MNATERAEALASTLKDLRAYRAISEGTSRCPKLDRQIEAISMAYSDALQAQAQGK